MDINTKPEGFEGSIASFGGIHPKIELPTEEMMGAPTQPLPSLDKLSLVDDQPQDTGLSLITGDETTAKVTGPTADNRIDRYSFALGKDYSKQDIDYAVRNGQEDWLRESVAQKRNNEENELKAFLVRDELSAGLPVDAKSQFDLYNKVKALNDYIPQNNPKTVVEKAYAEEYIRNVPFTGPDGGITQKLIEQTGNKVIDKISEEKVRSSTDAILTSEEIGRRGIMWQEVAKKHAEDQQERVKGEGWVEWMWEGAKNNAPIYSWYQTYNVIPGIESDQLNKGDSIASQVMQLHKLTPDQLDKTLEDLKNSQWSKDHPHETERFLDAVVSYGGTEQFLDNLFGVADLMGGAAGVGKASLKAGNIVSKGSSVVKAFADHVRANADPHATMGDRLAMVGDIKGSSVANAIPNAESLLSGNTGSATPLTFRQIASSLPSFVNPFAWQIPGIGSSAARSANLQNQIALNGQKVLDNIKDLLVVNRLPEEALQMAFKMEDDEFSKFLNYNVNSAVQNIQRSTIGPVAPVRDPIAGVKNTRPEETLANIGSVDFTLTKPDGSAFRDTQELGFWAERMFGLHSGDYGARQVGNGFEMTVSRALDETRPEVRDLLITTNNRTPFSLVGFLKSGGARVSEFNSNNRLAYLSGQQGLIESMKELAQNLRLGSKEWSKVNRVMQEDMQRANPLDPQNRPGKFLDTVQDFQTSYRRLNGHAPSERETNAYFTAIKVNEIEHQLRNASYLKEQSRLGLKDFTLKTKLTDPKGNTVFGETENFLGKELKALPTGTKDSKANGVVAIYQEGQDPVFRDLAILAGGDGKRELNDLLGQGYKIIQTANPVRKPGSKVFGEEIPVNFIITKDHTVRELNPNQIPYREGWHQSYDYDYFVKQPIINKVENRELVNGKYQPNGTYSHVFEGDQTWGGFRTEGEARKFSKAMDDARKIAYHGAAGNLDQFLAENLPYTAKQFHALFTPDPKTGKALFEKDHPFLHVSSGATTTDSHKFLSTTYENFTDAIRTPWNLVNQIDKKFVGARDELLNTVREEGTQANPIFKLQKAETIDPYSAMSQAMTNIMRNRFMIDYRIQSVESFLKEFGHLYGDIPEQELYANALDYLYQNVPMAAFKNPDLRNDAIAAENARRAIIELMGHDTLDKHLIEATKSMMVESIYEKFGQKASDFAATSELRKIKDPFKIIRSLAFHTSIGGFNPFQAFQNLLTCAQIAAISPTHGVPAHIASLLNYGAMRFTNSDPQLISTMANFAHEFGFDRQYFKEWHKEFKKSGRFSVEGEHAWQGDMEGPALHQTMFGKALDKATIFFKESERMVRTVAHATAYLEWRKANPTAQITGEIRNQILSRSNTLAGNMTKDQYAMWQQGSFLPTMTQFWSYQARLSEMMLNPKEGRGDRLSIAEKGRLILANSVLYGAPVGGMGTVVGGAFNPYDDIKAEALKRGVDIKDEVWEVFEKGLSGVTAHMLTGRSSDINEALGPKGHSIIDSYTDKSTLEFMFGTGGQKAIGVWKSATPLVNDIMYAIKGEDHPPQPRDVVEVLKNISSVNQATKLWIYFHNKDKVAYANNGQALGDLTNGAEASIWALTGALPTELGEDRVAMILMKDRQKTIKDIDSQIMRELQVIDKARDAKDADTIKAALSRIRVLTGGHTYQEAKKLFSEGVSAHKSLHDKVDRQWYLSTMNPKNQN